jgi:hypothetical protein
MASTLNASTSSGLISSGDTSGVLALQTNSGTTAVTIDTSQNVGIGTSSPSGKLHVSGGASNVQLYLSNNSYSTNYYQNTGGTTGVTFPASVSYVWDANGTERMRIDSSGNVGIGVTPSAWGANKVLQLGGGALALSSNGGGSGDGSLTWNGYYNGTNWIYSYTGGASNRMRLSETGAAWFQAPSGTAGGTISYTQAMTLDSSGNLLVGTTSNISSAKINIAAGSSDGVMYQIAQFTGGSGTGGNEVGEMKRQTTASVANSATTIQNSMTFGELITVTGVGAGAIFADLLMASYNTVSVISSNTQQGGPASRTYSVSSGALRLTMGSATGMAVTTQSLISGAKGA